MVRALDITDEPVTTEAVEPKAEPEFYTGDTIDNVDNFLHDVDSDFLVGPTGRAVYECLRYLGHRVDDLRGENHRLRERLSAVSSLSEYMHQNLQYMKFRAARADDINADPTDRLLLHIAERLDKIAGREFVPGRVVEKMICHRCGEVPDEGCKSCEGYAATGETWHDILWQAQEVPLNAKMGD